MKNTLFTILLCFGMFAVLFGIVLAIYFAGAVIAMVIILVAIVGLFLWGSWNGLLYVGRLFGIGR